MGVGRQSQIWGTDLGGTLGAAVRLHILFVRGVTSLPTEHPLLSMACTCGIPLRAQNLKASDSVSRMKWRLVSRTFDLRGWDLVPPHRRLVSPWGLC